MIGSRLKEFGLRNFKTLTAFSNALGILPQTLHNYISGKNKPCADLLIRLHNLGCDIVWLLTGEEATESRREENKIEETLRKELDLARAEIERLKRKIIKQEGQIELLKDLLAEKKPANKSNNFDALQTSEPKLK